MSNTVLWIIGIIGFILVFGGFVLLDVHIARKDKEDKPYATTCKNCGLDFDFGDLDIELYIDPSEEKHQITKCPRCHYNINVDP